MYRVKKKGNCATLMLHSKLKVTTKDTCQSGVDVAVRSCCSLDRNVGKSRKMWKDSDSHKKPSKPRHVQELGQCKPELTLTEILPSSLGKCAARNQSPGSGLVTLNAPVVRLGRVHVRVTAKEPGTIVSRGKRVSSGLMTGGAPDLKYL